MAIYLSMQRVRFSSPDGYEKFKMLFAGTRPHLMKLPGFLHLTWWVHPDDPTWFNEVSFWISKKALNDWHLSTYHKHAKQWAANGAIMEDIINNFELQGSRLLRVCPCCGHVADTRYELADEQKVLATPCPKCDYIFPVMPCLPNSTALFKDFVPDPSSTPDVSKDPSATSADDEKCPFHQ